MKQSKKPLTFSLSRSAASAYLQLTGGRCQGTRPLAVLHASMYR